MKHAAATLVAMVGLGCAAVLVRCSSDDPPTSARCDDWSGRASIGRRDAQNEAGRVCTDEADCVLVDYGLDCFADCGYPSAVARTAVPALEASIDALDERFCGPFEQRGCPGPAIPPCDPPDGVLAARCQNGQCTLEWIAGE
jgi:hypothetical protein